MTMPRNRRATHRRTVLRVLTAMKLSTRHLDRTWAVRSTVWEKDGHRPRALDEYPENRAEDWSMLISTLDDMITGLTTFREYAREQLTETEKLSRS